MLEKLNMNLVPLNIKMDQEYLEILMQFIKILNEEFQGEEQI